MSTNCCSFATSYVMSLVLVFNTGFQNMLKQTWRTETDRRHNKSNELHVSTPVQFSLVGRSGYTPGLQQRPAVAGGVFAEN